MGPLVYFQTMGVSQNIDAGGWLTEIQSKMRFNSQTQEEDLELSSEDSDVSMSSPRDQDEVSEDEWYRQLSPENRYDYSTPVVSEDEETETDDSMPELEEQEIFDTEDDEFDSPRWFGRGSFLRGLFGDTSGWAAN